MTTFKVAVTGTHSTGKTTFTTTLAEALQAKGYRTAYVSDLGEECRNAGFNILYDHTPQSTLWIMATGISRELHAALTADVIIVDRPVCDALGYYRAAQSHRHDASPERWARYLTTLADHHSATYDLIFHTILDPSIPLGINKPRDTDGRYRTMADQAITDLLAELGIDHRPLTTDNTAEAVQIVLDRLGQHIPAPLTPSDQSLDSS